MRTIQGHCVLASHDCSADDFSVPHSFSLHIELSQCLANQRTKKTWVVKVRLHSSFEHGTWRPRRLTARLRSGYKTEWIPSRTGHSEECKEFHGSIGCLTLP